MQLAYSSHFTAECKSLGCSFADFPRPVICLFIAAGASLAMFSVTDLSLLLETPSATIKPLQTGDMKRCPGNRIEGTTGCPSWCRPLRPLFHFLNDVSYPQSEEVALDPESDLQISGSRFVCRKKQNRSTYRGVMIPALDLSPE